MGVSSCVCVYTGFLAAVIIESCTVGNVSLSVVISSGLRTVLVVPEVIQLSNIIFFIIEFDPGVI